MIIESNQKEMKDEMLKMSLKVNDCAGKMKVQVYENTATMEKPEGFPDTMICENYEDLKTFDEKLMVYKNENLAFFVICIQFLWSFRICNIFLVG